MKSRLFKGIILVTFWSLLSSCEGVVSGSGKVISSLDKSPLDSVMLTWRTEREYTDKEGKFEIGQFVGCPTGCPDLEIILTKKGYATKYVNLTNGGPINVEGVIIELTPTLNPQADISNNPVGLILYYASMVIAGLGLITLVFLFIVKARNRGLWFFVILFGTVGLHYNFLADIFDFKLFRPVTMLNPHPLIDPSWYKLSIPIGVIAFWVYYFMRIRKKVVE